MQVCPDYAKHAPGKGSTAEGLAELQEEWQHSLNTVLGKVNDLQAPPPKEVRVPNQHIVLAFDHSLLVTIHRGLSFFKPDRRPLPLSRSHRRYFIDDAPVASVDGRSLACRRSCLFDESTGSSSYELPRSYIDDKEWRPTLHVNPDQGPVGWPCYIFLFEHLGCRGTVTPDPWHIAWNSIRAAAKSSGAWSLILETTVVQNCKRAPFGQCAFMNLIREATEEYFSFATVDDDLCQQFYPLLVADTGVSPPGFGTLEHMAQVFEDLKSSIVFRRTSFRVKLLRWFSWMDAMGGKCQDQGLLQNWHTLLFGLCVLGLRRKWWSRFDDLLQGGETSVGENAPPADGADGGTRPSTGKQQTMSEAREELNLKRKQFTNTLHFAAHVLAKPGNKERVAILVAISDVERQAQSLSITMCKTRMGSFEYMLSNARGTWIRTLASTAAVVHDTLALRKAGIAFPGEYSVSLSGSRPTSLSQQPLAEFAFDFCWQVLRRRSLNYLLFNAPPFCMLPLVGHSAEERERALASLNVL